MTILLKPLYDIDGNVVALGELESGEAATLPGFLEFPDGTTQTTAYTGETGAGGVVVKDVPPENPTAGQVWFESDTGKSFIYYLNEDGSGQWIESAQPTGPAGPIGETGITTTTIKEVPPAEPIPGEVWFESDSGNTYVWYINPTSGEGSWVNTCVLVGGAASGKMVVGTVDERPESPVTGQMRFNTTYDRLEVYGLSFWQLLKYDKEPGPPQIGEARSTGTTSASVDYTSHPEVGIDNVTSHTAVAYPGGKTGTLSQAESGTITVEGLDPATKYTFKVHSNNNIASGAPSAASNEVLTWSVPDAPTIGTPTVSKTSISVPFGAPAYNGGQEIISYTVVASPGDATVTVNGSGSGTAVFTDVFEYNSSYTFTVYATNASGNGPSSAVSESATMTSKKLANRNTGWEAWQADTAWSIDNVDGSIVATIGYWSAVTHSNGDPSQLVMADSNSNLSTWDEVGVVTLSEVGTIYNVYSANLIKRGWGGNGLTGYAENGWQMGARLNADNTVTVFMNPNWYGTGDDGTTITMSNLRTSFQHVSGSGVYEYTFPI